MYKVIFDDGDVRLLVALEETKEACRKIIKEQEKPECYHIVHAPNENVPDESIIIKKLTKEDIAKDSKKEKYYRYTVERNTYIVARNQAEADKKHKIQDFVYQEDELTNCEEVKGLPRDWYIF